MSPIIAALLLVWAVRIVAAATRGKRKPRPAPTLPGPRPFDAALERAEVPTLFVGKPRERHLRPPPTRAHLLGHLQSRYGGKLTPETAFAVTDYALHSGFSLRTLHNWTVRHGGRSLHLCLAAGLTENELREHLKMRTQPDRDTLAFLAALRQGPLAPPTD